MIRLRLWKAGNVLATRVDLATPQEAARVVLDDGQHEVVIARIETDEDLLSLEDILAAATEKQLKQAKLAVAAHVFAFWQRDVCLADGEGWRLVLRRQLGTTRPPTARG